ncbi:hypothetical protein WSM22_17810 [Cytophagales bacterium WSM2-2]|nr:hypothetical protein WSM22_17810 [Cytophagales bacterium WSM2-2]
MKQLIFESSPAFVLVSVLVGLGYATLLYRSKHPWSININRLLFGLRFMVVALLSFLLMGPILKLTNQLFEKPAVVLLVDNSLSLKEVVDSVKLKKDLGDVTAQLSEIGYDVKVKTLTDSEAEKIKFDQQTSDLNEALKKTLVDFEGKNLSGIVLFTDGIYNSGVSPVYSSWRVPVHTVGLGDTTEHSDLILKNVAFNKIVYQGNRFPVRAEIAVQALPNQNVSVSVLKNGVVVSQQQKNTGNKSFLEFDFLADAKDKGIQRLDVVIEPVNKESNLKNNRTGIFVEVVEGKKKILLIAPAPHPDIKALREVIEKNSNYELIVHIPGLSKTDPTALRPGQEELIIFHQPFDVDSKTSALYNELSKSKSSVLLIIGNKTNLRQLTAGGVPLNFENPFQKDEVTASVNAAFHDFDFVDNSNAGFSHFPPVQVPFGKFTYPPTAQVMLNQRIGSVITDRPMLLVWEDANHKTAAFIGEGLWRWRLDEFSSTEKTEIFDGTFSRLVQYLSTLEDKRKFRFFPVQNEFTDAAPALFEGQVYNDLFEKMYGNKIDLSLRNEQGAVTNYSYTLSPGGERYSVGGLKEGTYFYSASTEVNSKKETVTGQFSVTAQNVESQNLVADFGLLRKLSASTGGNFFKAGNLGQLVSNYKKTEAKSLIHTEETFSPLVQAKWFFFLLLVLISAEWFLRKYSGSY